MTDELTAEQPFGVVRYRTIFSGVTAARVVPPRVRPSPTPPPRALRGFRVGAAARLVVPAPVVMADALANHRTSGWIERPSCAPARPTWRGAIEWGLGYQVGAADGSQAASRAILPAIRLDPRPIGRIHGGSGVAWAPQERSHARSRPPGVGRTGQGASPPRHPPERCAARHAAPVGTGAAGQGAGVVHAAHGAQRRTANPG